jgi:hypothetical protein
MPKLCAFQVDQETIYINRVPVRMLRRAGPSASEHTVIVLGDVVAQTLKLPFEKVRDEIEAAINSE